MDFQKSDWSDSEKIAQLGEVLNADTVVTCQLSNIREKYMIAIYMIDVKTTEIMSAAPVYFIEDFMKLIDMMSFFANALAFNYGINGLPYYIGDRGTGGGTIFYVSKNGFRIYNDTKIYHYLECSGILSELITWCSRQSGSGCCNPATETGIGTGRANTGKIMAITHAGGKITESNCAAMLCAKYSTPTTKAGDWWLPSKDELDYIYSNLAKNGLIPASDWFWSSSSYNTYSAWLQRFSDGSQDDYHYKDYLYSVRAVRAF